MTTAPTNEAGHGLPDGLYGLVKAIRYNAENGSQDRPLHERLRLIAKDANEAIARLESLALSRGVPADMVLVPREPTEAMLDAADTAGDWGFDSLGGRFDNGNGDEIWAAMIKAAPATAGAQGGEYQRGYAQGVADTQKSPKYDSTGDTVYTQPATADGGFRDLLARAESAERQVAACRGVLVRWNTVIKFAEEIGYTPEETELMTYMAEELAIAGAEAALSSHRQAGEPVAEVRGYGDGGGVTMCWTSGKLAIGTKLYAAPPPGADLSNQKAFELLRELRTARPLLLYGDAWIQRIDSVLALVEKGAGNGT